MTFAFHHYSGMVLGVLVSRILAALFLGLGLSYNPLMDWAWGIFGLIVGGFADTYDWYLWKYKGWPRWKFHGMAHPPYNAQTGHGSIDRYMKWIPFWWQHTHFWDSIVHPDAPQVFFPKFNIEWANTKVYKNITVWDIAYWTLETILWLGYTWLFLKLL